MPRQRRIHGRAALALCLAAGALAACSTQAPKTSEQIGAGRTAIEAAELAGASDAASPQMVLARDKLAQARAAAQAGDQLRARRLAEEAEVDALVARSQAAAEKSRKAATEIDASLTALRDELTRQPTTAPVKP